MRSQTEVAGDDLRFWEYMAFVAYVIGLLAMAAFAWGGDGGLRTFGILWLVGTGAWLAGTVLGFLFGVPRVRALEGAPGVAAAGASVVPNTNLEQISDWLTKIIVGATLVQLGPLAGAIGDMAALVGRTTDTAPGAVGGTAAACGVLVLYFAAGFIWGYLWCSLRVFREMQALVRRERDVRSMEGGASHDL
jgi:hypothetical protein